MLASEYEQGLIARYQLEEADKHLKSPDLDKDPFADAQAEEAVKFGTQSVQNGEPDYSALAKAGNSLDLNSTETKQKIEFLKIQAQVSH